MANDHSGFKALGDIDMDGNDINKSNLLKYVTSDMTSASHTGDTTETTLATLTVPANTVQTAIIILGSFSGNCAEAGSGTNTYRIKIGASGSETTKQTVVVDADANFSGEGGSLVWYETGQTWTAAVSVLITGECGHSTGTVELDSVVILGY